MKVVHIISYKTLGTIRKIITVPNIWRKQSRKKLLQSGWNILDNIAEWIFKIIYITAEIHIFTEDIDV